MLDHQLHDAGCDGEVDELLRGEPVYQAVNQGSGKGISGPYGFQAVDGMDWAFVEVSIL